ncbi:MAG TPA: threonine synthase, partial [Myxococcales bacterium]|nr:threonine synthase [Myxococcales bacterium]
MQYSSTNRQANHTSFREALLKGQAPDRGLYFPEGLPSFPEGCWQKWKGASYAEIAAEVLGLFLEDEVAPDVLRAICEDAYNFPVPIEHVEEKQYILRLDQGPTASFKDFAARAMARLMSRFIKEEQRKLLILTATSGDTGSAIAHAFYGVEGIEVVVLFPRDEVSNRQRKQMTTLGGNITAIAIDGKFDDCQAFVKQAFADDSLSHVPLSSANSINIGRLLPQMVYYIYTYCQLAQDGEECVISVPCGNFGNVMGGIIAKWMGLPVKRFVIAVNENDEVPRFLQDGEYHKIEPSRNCISNAMNVGHPSNLARLVHLYGGFMDEKGAIHEEPDLQKLRDDLFAVSVTDAETRETIKEAYQ